MRSCCRSISASRTSNLGVGDGAGRPPHLVGEELLKHFGIAPGTPRRMRFTYLDFAKAARRYGKLGGFAHLATLVKRLQAPAGPARCCSMAATPGRDPPPRCGPRAQDMVDAAKLLGVDVMTGALGVHLRRGAGAGDRRQATSGSIEFLAQNVRTADFDDPVFKPYVDARDQWRACRDHRPGVSLHADREPALLRRRTGRSASRKNGCRRWSTRCARKGAQVVVLLSHNGMDVDLKLASRVTRHRRHPRRPHARRRAAAGARQQRGRHDARHQCRLATASSSACSTST